MRIYYIFDINNEYLKLYKDNPSTLYNILNQVYYMKNNDIVYGYSLYSQIIKKVDKFYIDKYIFVAFHNKMKYTKRNDEHIINNLYKNEISIMKVKHSHIIINSNRDNTEFFDILYDINSNLFVCDFVNQDYFFISNLKMLV